LQDDSDVRTVPCPHCGKPLNIIAGICTAKNGCGKLYGEGTT
jgi:hypothetical protein